MANRISKNTVPDDFTLPLVFTDLLPVIFFGLASLLLGSRIHSPLFTAGASVCLATGTAKILWKLIVVVKRVNIWPLFLQMRIFMPLGFLIMVISLVLHRDVLTPAVIGHAIFQLPAGIFFVGGLAGIILMIIFSVRLDSSDLRSNWIEQLTNGAAQCAFFIGLLLIR